MPVFPSVVKLTFITSCLFQEREIIYKTNAETLKTALLSAAGRAVTGVTISQQEFLIKRMPWKNGETGKGVFDFDGCLTLVGITPDGTSQGTIWQEIGDQLVTHPGLKRRMSADYHKYAGRTDIDGQKEWADRAYENFHKAGVTRQNLLDIADNIILRPWVTDFIKEFIAAGHKIAIVSYGMKQVIERVLEKNGIRNYVTAIYADTLKFSGDHLRGVVDYLPRVVPANKDVFARIFIHLNEDYPKRAIIVGDSVHDLQMFRGNPQALRIYLNHPGSYTAKGFNYHNLKEAVRAADVVIATPDWSFQPVADFINWATYTSS